MLPSKSTCPLFCQQEAPPQGAETSLAPASFHRLNPTTRSDDILASCLPFPPSTPQPQGSWQGGQWVSANLALSGAHSGGLDLGKD